MKQAPPITVWQTDPKLVALLHSLKNCAFLDLIDEREWSRGGSAVPGRDQTGVVGAWIYQQQLPFTAHFVPTSACWLTFNLDPVLQVHGITGDCNHWERGGVKRESSTVPRWVWVWEPHKSSPQCWVWWEMIHAPVGLLAPNVAEADLGSKGVGWKPGWEKGTSVQRHHGYKIKSCISLPFPKSVSSQLTKKNPNDELFCKSCPRCFSLSCL